jgi:saccharopine dehydrogenase (NAD+, L-glutamate forming)
MARMPAGTSTYEIVLFGATGFTGGLTADYLARHGPRDLRWAIAGRSRERLDAIAQRLHREPAGGRIEVLTADAGDPDTVAALAASTAVVASTVGPFLQHGAELVAACAANGTDYLDITGEPEFVDRMWLRHHERAVATGARLVHACGFDSVPTDLGVLFTLGQLPADVPVTVEGFVRAHAAFSGGTHHSAVRALGRARQSSTVARQRRALEGSPSARRVRRPPPRLRRVPGGQRWALPLPTIDPVIVRRSARALDAYGPDFAYGHYADVGTLPRAVATAAGVAGVAALSQLSLTRQLLLRLQDVGAGPDEATRADSWFRIAFAAIAGDTTVLTEVSGGDPGYTETAKMLAEAALCMARDELPVTAGQVTTAQAMGTRLLTRLQAAGLSFRVVAGI